MANTIPIPPNNLFDLSRILGPSPQPVDRIASG